MKNIQEFLKVSQTSGVNNASRMLYRSFVERNKLTKPKGDKRQNFTFDGNLYGVSVNTRDVQNVECRQFDDDYKGFVCLDLHSNKVLLVTKSNTKVKGQSLIRASSGNASNSVKAVSVIEVSSLSIFNN